MQGSTAHGSAPGTGRQAAPAIEGDRQLVSGGRAPCPLSRPGDSISLRLLLIAAEEGDPCLTAMAGLLDVLGTPYDVIATSRQRLTAEQLADNAHAHYQGIITVAGGAAMKDGDAGGSAGLFSQTEWRALRAFQARFGIRQAILCCPAPPPHGRFGLDPEPVETSDAPALLALTGAGRDVFWYLNAQAPLTIRNAPLWLARPRVDAATPLLLAPDGRAAAVLRTFRDGCEDMILTVGLTAGSVHAQLLGYGVVNWVCRGLFLGSRRVYLGIHVDDVFAGAQLWDPSRQAVSSDRQYRIGCHDVEALLGWLERVRSGVPNAAGVSLDLAFNGGGITGGLPGDALASCLAGHQASFRWVNHGFSHRDCDGIGYEDSLAEILRNNEVARSLGFRSYVADSLVTPQVSGLSNPEFLRAAADAGVRYLVSDTSHPGWRDLSRNASIACASQPGISILPRHPTNLYANVSTPDEWVAEYNHHYHNLWQRDLDFGAILDVEAEAILGYLLTFDMDPLMFHQANLRSYNGGQSLLSELIDRVLTKYNAVYGEVPIRSLSMHAIGEAMRQRTLYNAAQVEAQLVHGVGLVLVADREVTVPLTGVSAGEHSETYAGQSLSWVTVAAAEPCIVPMSDVVASR